MTCKCRRFLTSIGVAFTALWLSQGHAATAPRDCPPVVVATPASAARPALDRGLLWKITRGGHSSYLYGTLHVGKPSWKPGPLTAAALASSDRLALEIDPGDPALAQALTSTGPPMPLTPGTEDRLRRAFERACLPRQALAGLDPVLQATTLTVVEARWLGLDAQYAQEQLLLTLARKEGLPLATLETPAEQVALLTAADPVTADASVAELLTQLEDGSGRRVLQRLSQAWEHGDLAALDDFERWCECAATVAERADLQRLNDARNPALAAGIEALHDQGLSVFAAVGALHMTGPQSLPRLLAQAGFAVERIRFGH
ncbi:MAG: TraB/GumN family protein [Pseudomonadota bacterium]|nr:TraB/GumN family protein [Pseudomonadota bacterium]